MKQVAIVGGGLAGLTAAWQMHRLGVPFTLFEASARVGGTVETVRRDGFVIETGPDGWVTEKPWATELVHELGLSDELIHSSDATRVTYILQGGRLVALPDGLRMMVPTDLGALAGSPLFSAQAIAAYASEPARAAELKALAPTEDESIASFVLRHFGAEVLAKVGAPLLSGVFGGDVERLSVRAVMPKFVQMERDHGSLISAFSAMARRDAPKPVFTSLRNGVESLVERMASELPSNCVRLNTPVTSVVRSGHGWTLATAGRSPGTPEAHVAEHVILATPPRMTRRLLGPGMIGPEFEIEASSCVIAALAFARPLELPRGFGFLVPAGEPSTLMAATFVEGKYSHRAPAGAHLIRAFFGGSVATRLAEVEDAEIAAEAHRELARLLQFACGQLPQPDFSVVRRWPDSLPQYAVGHLERMDALDTQVNQRNGLHLLGNAYRGVGLPDLIREARSLARQLV
jgi:oxygen-dependent protoporphyrinogen oxidase